jgi:maleate isomerase
MKLPFETDGGESAIAALGIIVLQSDETLEAEFRSIFNVEGIALYHSRIPSSAEVTTSTLKQMERELPQAASLLPTARPLNVVGYGCTSGATVIGADNVASSIRTKHPDAKVTDPITAVMAACRHLGVSQIGLVTPYIASVSAAMRELLEENQLSIAGFGSFEQVEEAVVARIAPQSVLEAICEVGQAHNVEAVFASCTNLRSFGIIEEAEAAIGKPVISSNQALAWHMAELAGLAGQISGPGQLFRS